MKKLERLKKKEKDVQKKIEKASTRSGQSFAKDMVDVFKKAVTPEFTKIGKTIKENQDSHKKLENLKKDLDKYNKK